MVTRRNLLKGMGLASIGAATLHMQQAEASPPIFTDDPFPFPLGVASGDPLPDSVIIWTRVAELSDDPAGLGGLTAASIAVDWAVSTDATMINIVASGTAQAVPALGYSVHVDVSGLSPSTAYFYRFRQADRPSRLGKTRTAAVGSTALVRFAFVSCQDFNGRYAAFTGLSLENLDFVIHLGDTIYEGSQGVVATDLTGYRLKHARFRRVVDARAAWASHPFITTWDDHEVANNYWGRSADYFSGRREAAYQAYYEHMPLRPPAGLPGQLGGPSSWRDLQIYRRYVFGNLVDLTVPDLRQYRDAPGQLTRSMLGNTQKAWLLNALSSSAATWKVIGSALTMADVFVVLSAQQNTGLDAWEGYQAKRRELLLHIRNNGIRDVVVVSGDAHRSLVSNLVVGDLEIMNGRFLPADQAVAVEFNGTSISSNNETSKESAEPDILGTIADPSRLWIRYNERTYRGYTVCDVTPAFFRATYKVLQDRSKEWADNCMTTLCAYRVDQGVSPPQLTKESFFVPFQLACPVV